MIGDVGGRAARRLLFARRFPGFQQPSAFGRHFYRGIPFLSGRSMIAVRLRKCAAQVGEEDDGRVTAEQQDEDRSRLSAAVAGAPLSWPEDNNTDDDIAAAAKPDRRPPNPGAVFSAGLAVLPR
jgi:hypothetical protein